MKSTDNVQEAPAGYVEAEGLESLKNALAQKVRDARLEKEARREEERRKKEECDNARIAAKRQAEDFATAVRDTTHLAVTVGPWSSRDWVRVDIDDGSIYVDFVLSVPPPYKVRVEGYDSRGGFDSLTKAMEAVARLAVQ